MRRIAALTLGGLILLGACHRRQADVPVPGAEAEARTAAKARADVEAAEQAASGPIPPGLDRPAEPVAVTPKADAALPQDAEAGSEEIENSSSE